MLLNWYDSYNPINPKIPSKNFLFHRYASEILDPFYTIDELNALYLLAKRKKLNKKNYLMSKCSNVFNVYE